MQLRFRIYMLLFVFCLATGCSTTADPEDVALPPILPKKNTALVQVPTSAPIEVQSQTAFIGTQSLLISLWYNIVAGLTPSSDGATWTWTRTQNGLTVSLIATVNADSSVAWQMMLTGQDSSIPFATFDNWTAVSGTATYDAMQGSWTIYELNSTSPIFLMSWQEANDGTLTVTADLSASMANKSIVSISSPDGSGSLTSYDGSVKLFEATWDGSGAGSWKRYNPDGSLLDSGTWV